MACPALLGLLSLSIIFTKQVEGRTLNKANIIAVNPKYAGNQKFDEADAMSNGSERMKKIHANNHRQSYTNPKYKHGVTRNKYKLNSEFMDNEEANVNVQSTKTLPPKDELDNRNNFSIEKLFIEKDGEVNLKNKNLIEELALNIAIEKVKNEESLKHAAAELRAVKPIYRQKYTQAITENSLITEIDGGMYKHRENKKSYEKESREDDIYELKRHNAFETPSKNDIKLSQDNKKNFRHGDDYEAIEESVTNQINSDFTPKYELKFLKRSHQNSLVAKNKKIDLSKQYPMKRDLRTNQDKTGYIRNKNCGSEEHECVPKVEYQKIYGSTNNLNANEDTHTLQEHEEKRLDTLKMLRQENERNILNHNYNKKKSDTLSLENEIYALKQRLDEIKRKKSKAPKEISMLNKPLLTQKYQDGKIVSKNNPEKVISNFEEQKHKRYFETNANSEGCIKNNTDSEDKLKDDKGNSKIVDDHVEKEITDSLEDNIYPSLPFYISTALSVKDKDKKETKTFNNLKTILREKKNINNVINNKMNHLVSSKVLDFITDRVTGKVLKRLKSLTPQNNQLRSATIKPETEQIGILFQENGDMQMVMNREHLTTKKVLNQSGDIETFYL